MKKLLVTAIGAAAAFGAVAGTISTISTQRFETAELGPTNIVSEGTYWSGDALTNTYTVVSAAGEDIHEGPFGVDAPTKALEVKTTFGSPLKLNAIAGGSSTNIPASGIYFDSLVKFTVCEDEPEQSYPDAKIVMWLQEQTDGSDNITGTNIMVRASYANADGTFTPTNFVCKRFTGSIDSWYRVTIKTWASILNNKTVPGFAIFIDGVSVNVADEYTMADEVAANLTEAAGYFGKDEVFPSLVQGEATGVGSITSASFDGTGKLTDLVFTDEAPFDAAKDYVAPKASVTIGELSRNYDTLAEAVAAVNGATAGQTATMQLKKGMVIGETLAFASKANVILDFAGVVLTNESDSVAAITANGAGNLIITNSTEAVGGVRSVDAAAIAQGEEAGVISIYGGNFWGSIISESIDDSSIQLYGGSFSQNTYTGWLAADKMFSAQGETYPGLYDVVDYVPPTYTITVEGGEHFTVAVTTNEVAAGAAGAYVVTEGDSVAVTYTADTGYTLSKDSDSIAPVSADATIAAPTATLQTFKVIFVDGELSRTNVVDYGSSSVGVVPEFAGRTGYTAAWDSDPTAVVSVTSDLTFTAVYTAIEYTITYKTAEGEAFTSWADNYAAPAIFTVAQLATLPTASDVALAVGVTFNGWTNDVGTAVTDTEGLTANLVVFANVTVPGPVTPTIDPANPSPVEVTAASEAAAIEAVALTAPSGVDAAAYKALFNIEATNKGGDAWEVELTGIKEEIKTEVSEDAVDVLTSATGTGTVVVPAGLYYRITRYTAIGTAVVETPATGLSTGSGVSVDKPGDTQGFIKVEMSTVPFNN